MLASLSVNILRATIVVIVGLVVVLAGLDSVLSEILLGLVFAAMIWSDRDHPLSSHFAMWIVIGSLIFPWLRRGTGPALSGSFRCGVRQRSSRCSMSDPSGLPFVKKPKTILPLPPVRGCSPRHFPSSLRRREFDPPLGRAL